MNNVDINITLPEVKTEVDATIKKVDFNLEIAGQRGKQGLSAYEIAVKNGFIGTEQEWLDSLKAESYQPYDSVYEFPNIGSPKIIYVDASENRIYRWDAENLKYFCIGSDWSQIEIVYGGNANG